MDKAPKSAGAARATPAPKPDFGEHLVCVEKIGGGAYGQVFKCDDLRTPGKQVAVKWMRNFALEPLPGKRTLREIRLLRSLQHENVLRLIDVLPVPHPDFDDIYVVLPYMHLDLHRVINSKMKLSESHVQAFICQILRGVNYLHSAGIVHRDLKPMNVLVNKDCSLRIADFGLARGRSSENEELTGYVVTRWYRAPELMLYPTGYFEAVDLWSVGCIHVELLARAPLFPGDHHLDMLRRIGAVLGFVAARDLAWVPAESYDDVSRFMGHLSVSERPTMALEEHLPNVPEACLELVRRLLTFDPNRRISAIDALCHPYLAHLADPAGLSVAEEPFSWDFDDFDATERAVKDRVYLECAACHPEILQRDAKWFAARKIPVVPPPRG